MTTNRLPTAVLSLALAALASACASAPPPNTGVTIAAGSGLLGTGSAAQKTALATADSAARAFAPADVEFMSGMIPHHAQAVQMAGWAPSHGARADVQRLCERIVVAQKDEIRMMRRWLGERAQEVPDSLSQRHIMKMGAMVHEMMMPGMLTVEEMAALEKARGAAFDRLFLVGMIRHHRGAIAMVDELFSHGNAGHDETVFRFANDVVSDQSAEIQKMLVMLETVPPLH